MWLIVNIEYDELGIINATWGEQTTEHLLIICPKTR